MILDELRLLFSAVILSDFKKRRAGPSELHICTETMFVRVFTKTRLSSGVPEETDEMRGRTDGRRDGRYRSTFEDGEWAGTKGPSSSSLSSLLSQSLVR